MTMQAEREAEREKARRERNERVPFDWKLVKVDQSRYCDAEWLAKKGVASCGVFYLYDANRHVHICSFQATYELHPVAGWAVPVKDGDLTEEESEALFDVEQEMLNTEESVTYMDVSPVDRMPSEAVKGVPEREEGEDGEAYYLRACEELREYYAGNTPWF